MTEFEKLLADLGASDVAVLHAGEHDALVFRLPVLLSPVALQRLRETLETWTEKSFGRRIPCLVLEEGAQLEVREARACGISYEMMQQAEQEEIR